MRGADDHPTPPAVAERRIAVLALATQTVCDDLLGALASPAAAGPDDAQASPTLRICGSTPDLLRAIRTAQEEYLVFSRRPGLVWDEPLVRRVAREIAAVEDLDIPWFCLCAEGVDIDGESFASAFFNYEPTLVPDRGRRLIVQTAGTLCVVKAAALRSLGLLPAIYPDLQGYLNALIAIAYARGDASLFSSHLFPCVAEHRALHYLRLEEQLFGFSPEALLPSADVAALFPTGVSRQALLTDWVATLQATLRARHRFSFVVRTLFRRGHLLRRCLISIDYLRSSLGIPVEIVLASDVPAETAEGEMLTLGQEFPHLTFVLADGGALPGHSRVRNLMAGLQATTGARVCIIDDDDYYAPQATAVFETACAFGTEWLIVFDTQIIEEKWLEASVKWHKEIVGYGPRFDAKSWATTLRGSNSIPLCGLIHPGWFARQVASEYVYDFDLSEDFVFHLLCFSHPKRPPIRLVEGVSAYQSHRVGSDNVSNVEDRTGWVVDTGNGLYQLLFESGRTFDVISSAEAAGHPAAPQGRLAALEAELERANRGQAGATRLLVKLVRQATSGAS